MKMKKNWKRFFTLDRHHAEGFTLVELIVVIAILAILGGVAVPAYSGYIKKANMGADQTLVSEVVHALYLQHYATPEFEGSASIILTADGTTVGGYTEFATKAMEATFGSGWQSMALQYDGWEGTGIMNQAMTQFGTWEGTALGGLLDGTVTPVFKDDIDELYNLVEDTATTVGGKINASGMELIQGAAGQTMNKDAAGFAELWAGTSWDSSFLMGGDGSEYNEDSIDDARKQINSNTASDDTTAMFSSAIANAGVIKARNTSLAIYMRDNGYEDYYDMIANYTMGTSGIPDDITAANGIELRKIATNAGMTAAEATQFANAVNTMKASYIGDGSSSSQAYQDALAYYGMMNAVNDVNKDGNEETYWDDMKSAVDLYGSIAKGEASYEDMKGVYTDVNAPEGSVVVTVIIKDGQVSFITTPATANVTE